MPCTVENPLIEIVAEAAFPHARLCWSDDLAWGTLLGRRGTVVCAIVPFRGLLIPFDHAHRSDIVVQGRAGAIAGVLANGLQGKWFWAPWLLFQYRSEGISTRNPMVQEIGRDGRIDFSAILKEVLCS